MEFEKYKNTDPYPKRPIQPILSDRSPKGHREYADALEMYEKENEKYRKEKNQWRNKQAELEGKFKEDLFDELCITNNPKADLLYAIAWDKGHACGLSDVYSIACELVPLIE